MKIKRRQLRTLIEAFINEAAAAGSEMEPVTREYYEEAKVLINNLKRAIDEFRMNNDIVYLLETAIDMQDEYENAPLPSHLKSIEDDPLRAFYKRKQTRMERMLIEKGIDASGMVTIEQKKDRLRSARGVTQTSLDNYEKACADLKKHGEQAFFFGPGGYEDPLPADGYNDRGLSWDKKSEEVDLALRQITTFRANIIFSGNHKHYLKFYQSAETNEKDDLGRYKNILREQSKSAHDVLVALENFVDNRLMTM